MREITDSRRSYIKHRSNDPNHMFSVSRCCVSDECLCMLPTAAPSKSCDSQRRQSASHKSRISTIRHPYPPTRPASLPTLTPHAHNCPPDSKRTPDHSSAQTPPNHPSACYSSRNPSTPAYYSSPRSLCPRSSTPAIAHTCTSPGQCPVSQSSDCLPAPRCWSMSMGQKKGVTVSSARVAHAA